MRIPLRRTLTAALAVITFGLVATMAQQRPDNPFPGGTNPDGSLRPTPPLNRLFTQDAYTEYAILEPAASRSGSASCPRKRAPAPLSWSTRRAAAAKAGDRGLRPAHRQALPFTYEQDPKDPETHAIHAKLPIPVPAGGIGRVLIYKTYKDPRTYTMHGEDIVWVRSLSGYRLGVLLPKGFTFLSSNVAAQLSTTSDGRLKLAFANPSGQSNPVTIHARRTTIAFPPTPGDDMFFDDVKTLYDLGAPETHTIAVDQSYSDYRKGGRASLDTLSYLPLRDLKVTDLDTAKTLPPAKSGNATNIALEVPIENEKQSVHLRLTGTLVDPAYTLERGELVFARTLKGLRNTILLPEGYEVSAVSQSGTIGKYNGRTFVALINLNAENQYAVRIHARRAGASSDR